MKNRADLAIGWLRKAQSDMVAMEASQTAGALDAACFHAQQAAEKYLKGFLAWSQIEFPYTHNLSKLVEICAAIDPSFQSLLPIVESLTPFAVESRYDSEFWPELEVVESAKRSAEQVRNHILDRAPAELSDLFRPRV